MTRDPNQQPDDWTNDESVDRRLDELLDSAGKHEIAPGQVARLRQHLDSLLGESESQTATKPDPIRSWRPGWLAAAVAVAVVLLAIPLIQRLTTSDPENQVAGIGTNTDSGQLHLTAAPPKIDFARIESTIREMISHAVRQSEIAARWRTVLATRSALNKSGLQARVQSVGEDTVLVSSRLLMNQIDQVARTSRPKTHKDRKQLRELVQWRYDFPKLLMQELIDPGYTSSRRARPKSSPSLSSRKLVSDRFLFRLVCATAQPDNLIELAPWVDDPDVGTDVCNAWIRVADSRSIAQLTLTSRSDTSRTTLMVALLSRGDAVSSRIFLETASQMERMDLVLASASKARSLPTDSMIAALDDSRQSIVRCAAAVLSQDDRRTVTLGLAELLDSPRAVRGAMLALAGRTDPLSQELSSALQSDLRNTALFSAAQRQWKAMIPVVATETRYSVPLFP